ncbi:MAG: RsiG family protein [Acidimicrobiia bacterium]
MTEHVRRLDRILAPEYTEGLDGRSLDELRAMERECLEVETEVSYVRRLAQGRIDILEAERDRRAAGGSLGDLIAALPKLLADDDVSRSGPASTRAQPFLAPAASIEWNRGLERLVTDGTLANLPNLSDAELQATLGQLHQLEQEVSARRRVVHGALDAVTHAIAARLAPAE